MTWQCKKNPDFLSRFARKKWRGANLTVTEKKLIKMIIITPHFFHSLYKFSQTNFVYPLSFESSSTMYVYMCRIIRRRKQIWRDNHNGIDCHHFWMSWFKVKKWSLSLNYIYYICHFLWYENTLKKLQNKLPTDFMLSNVMYKYGIWAVFSHINIVSAL